MKKLLLLIICILPINLFAQNWSTQYTGTVYDISFPDSLHGWAAGGKMTGSINGRVLYTKDGGKTWTGKAMGNIEDTIMWINRICFADSLRGWAGGEHTKVSTGGYWGRSWFLASTSNGFNTCVSTRGDIWSHYDAGGVFDMETVSGALFWAYWHSDCNGLNYAYINGIQMSNYCFRISLSFVDGGYGWAYLNKEGFFRTTTGVSGLTHLYDLPIVDIDFVDTIHGWAVGNSGKILYTDKGGADSIWEQENSGVTNNLTCVKFVDSLNGWAGGEGVILRTRNGGSTWEVEATVSGIISRICCLDTNYVWALFPADYYGSVTGSILKYHPYVGIEENWSEATSGTSRSGGTALEIFQNPFSHSTTIKFSVVGNRHVCSLQIYDISGQCVKTLVDKEKEAGNYSIVLNANELKTGIYFVKLSTENYSTTKKLILME
jgi:hypothetical protein